jgi:hypothetical protein
MKQPVRAKVVRKVDFQQHVPVQIGCADAQPGLIFSSKTSGTSQNCTEGDDPPEAPLHNSNCFRPPL